MNAIRAIRDFLMYIFNLVRRQKIIVGGFVVVLLAYFVRADSVATVAKSMKDKEAIKKTATDDSDSDDEDSDSDDGRRKRRLFRLPRFFRRFRRRFRRPANKLKGKKCKQVCKTQCD